MSSMDMPTIPVGFSAPLLDSAVEIETDDQLSVSLDGSLGSIESQAKSEPSEGGSVVGSPTVKLGPALHDRSQSFSFGQTIFRSMAGAESSPAIKTQSSQRGRAMSDTVFASMLSSPLAAVAETKGYKRPEADINDPSQAIVAYQAPPPPPPNEKERDPFAANATTYYVPGMMLPPSPPQSQHTRTASREEDIIWSLRTQVALQSELCSQYEVDLSAKDEMLQALTTRLTDSEKEIERRKIATRNWRKRVGELEKCVRGLEEEVDRSREVSMDRSVMDEASGEALRMLHRQISQLEKEKKESDQREKDLKARFESTAAQLAKAQEEIRRRDQSESELKAGIKAAKDEMELMGELGKEQAQDERDRRQSAQAWEEERSALKAANDSLRDDHLTAQAVITGLREEIVTKENELGVLKAELEAQWKHTEHSTEEMEKLKQERDALAREADELREKLASVEADWDDNDQRKQELEHELQDAWAAREEIEQERAEVSASDTEFKNCADKFGPQLERQLRSEQDHAEELTRALQEREDRVSILEQERQYAHDNVSRLQESLRQRDAEISKYEQRIREREAEVEEVRESLTKQKREHARIVDEQSRRISEVVAREVEARAHMENMVKGKAENDVNASTLKERVNALKDEVERLRRQVHELQQESADKDMKLVQSAKQRAQDKEDMQGLNIALDSKQQELELVCAKLLFRLRVYLFSGQLKRRLGTRTSAGSTPASKAPLRRESSASGVFSTPSAVRPPSALSDASSTTKERKSDPASTTKSSLARSVRPNGSVVNSARSSLAPSASKGRISLAPAISTPARNGSVLARSSSVTPMPPPKHRRVSSSVESLRAKGLVSTRESPSASSASEQEKENIETTPVVRSGRIPVPA